MSAARIFLSYARADAKAVSALYRDLEKAGSTPWMDSADLRGGERWESSIRDAIAESDLFLPCLTSASVSRRGEIQAEIRLALERSRRFLEDDVFIIPVRLEKCSIPKSLQDFHWVDLFAADGFEQLVDAIGSAMARRHDQAPPKTPAAPAPVRAIRSSTKPDAPRLRRLIVEHFTSSELDRLCADVTTLVRREPGENDFRVSLDIVGGSGLEDQAHALIGYLERRRKLAYLIRAMRQERPDLLD